MKKEAIEYLNDLAIEFRQHSKDQISNTIRRAIHENFHLNNQIDYLSKQLENSIEMNEKSRRNNEQLTRTVAILEDVENQSAKKYLTLENVGLNENILDENILLQTCLDCSNVVREIKRMSTRENKSHQSNEFTSTNM